MSQSERLLAADTYSGQFITGNAEPVCSLNPWPPTWGSYSLAKRIDLRQDSAADPFPETNTVSNAFVVAVNSSAAGSLLTAASLARPDGVVSNLALAAGIAQLYETTATEAVLDAKYPPGDYVLRFTQHAQPERVITFSLPPAFPPVPKITNFDDASSLTAPTWSEVGTVLLDVTGKATFEDAQAGKTFPLYYRATAR